MKVLMICIVSFCFAFSIHAQSAEGRLKHYNLEEGIALQGHDPVAYFTARKALKGRKEFAYTYQGVVYYFFSQDNKYLFMKNPGHYEPQYGGWCAFAMGDSGEKVEIDPKTFKITDGKLYLFYNLYFTNTLTKWNENEQALKKKGDAHWTKIITGK